MVAFSRIRSRLGWPVAAFSPSKRGGLGSAGTKSQESAFGTSAAPRAEGDVEIRRSPAGPIIKVRIGPWRVLTTTDQRQLAEVRELSCGRIAVRIEKFAGENELAASEIWQLYSLEGRLEASLHTTADGQFTILADYQTRQVCRLTADPKGILGPVEMWSL